MTNYPQKGFNLTNYSVTDLGVVRVLKLQSATRDCLLAARIAQQEAEKQIL